MVVVLLSACFMQEVTGILVSHADSKDDTSCAQCLPAVNKALGSDCEELRCIVQASAAKKDTIMASEVERKKARGVVQDFLGCARKNKCSLETAQMAQKEFDIELEDLMPSFLQVHEEVADEDAGPCAKCLPRANKFVGSDCKDFVCIVKAFDEKKTVIMGSEDRREDAEALRDSIAHCAKENKCDLQPALSAAAELGIDLSR